MNYLHWGIAKTKGRSVTLNSNSQFCLDIYPENQE